jgi:hypothetical protein
MSLCFSRLGLCLGALWLAATACLDHVQAQGTPRPHRSLELTETNSAEILTNLNLLSTKKEGVRELDDQLKALKSLSPSTTFEGNWYVPYVPPSGSAVPTKALKELLQRQMNWGLSPEEMGAPTANPESDTFSVYGDDKGDKDKKSSLQQFYDALNNRSPDRKRQDGTAEMSTLGANKRFGSQRDLDVDEDRTLPSGIRENAQKLKAMAKEDSSSIFNPTRARTSFDNFFGLREEAPTREPVEQTKQGSGSFIDQFKKTLDRQSAATAFAPSLNGLLPNASSTRSALMPGLDPFVASTHHEVTETSPGNSTTLLDPTAMRDLNSTLLNQWNPMYQPPKLELPKGMVPASASVMQVPRRRF